MCTKVLSHGVKRLGSEADHSLASRAEVKNKWGYTSTPLIRLHKVERENFSLLPLLVCHWFPVCIPKILWSKDIRNERKLNIYNALIKSGLLYGSETWGDTENNKRRVEGTDMDALRRSSRISRKERIRNVTIRKQTGLEETIIKEIEQNELTWYGHVQRMAEGRLPKIALKWVPKQARARGRPNKNWMEGIRKAMNERNLNEIQWEDRKQWSLGFGQRRKTF
jgi:hypothetical protein